MSLWKRLFGRSEAKKTTSKPAAAVARKPSQQHATPTPQPEGAHQASGHKTPSESISITCSSCKKKLKVSLKMVGKKGKCPGCESIFMVPTPETTGVLPASAPKAVDRHRPQTSKNTSSRVACQIAPARLTDIHDSVSDSVTHVATLNSPDAIKELYFFPKKGCLCAQSADGGTAWMLGDWQPMSIDWLPDRNVIALAMKMMVPKLTSEMYSSEIGHGQFQRWVGFEDTGAGNSLQNFLNRRELAVLWDCMTQEIACAACSKPGQPQFRIGNQHVAVKTGSEPQDIRLFKYTSGKVLDIDNPLRQLTGGNAMTQFLFFDNDQYFICNDAPIWQSNESSLRPFVVHSLTQEDVSETVPSIPPRLGAAPQDSQWILTFLEPSPGRLLASAIWSDQNTKAATILLFDPLSGNVFGQPLRSDTGLIVAPEVAAPTGSVAWVTENNTLQIHQIISGTKLLSEQLPTTPTKLVFSASGEHLAVQVGDTEIRVYELTQSGKGNRKAVETVPVSSPPPPALATSCSPNRPDYDISVIQLPREFPSLSDEASAHADKAAARGAQHMTVHIWQQIASDRPANNPFVTAVDGRAHCIVRLQGLPPNEMHSLGKAVEQGKVLLVPVFAYCPTSPVLGLKFAICDSPNDPYSLDAPRDLRDGNVQDFLAAFLKHGEGEFLLFSEPEAKLVGQCSFSLRIAPFAFASTTFPRKTTAQDLDGFWESLKKAAEHLKGILPAQRDFNRAKELYYKNVPL